MLSVNENQIPCRGCSKSGQMKNYRPGAGTSMSRTGASDILSFALCFSSVCDNCNHDTPSMVYLMPDNIIITLIMGPQKHKPWLWDK